MVDYLFKSASPVNKIMFMPTISMYDDTLENLIWIPPSKHLKHAIPAVFIHRDDAEYIVIYSHGNAMDIAYVHDIAKPFVSKLKVSFLAFEYTGYGLAPRKVAPSEKTSESDFRSTYDFVRNTLGWPHDRIILYGQSIGSGIACYGCRYTTKMGEPPMAMILHSAFTSIKELAINYVGMMGRMVANRFDNIGAVELCSTVPLLVTHGDEDDVIPYEMGQRLYQRATTSIKEFHTAKGKDHNSLNVARDVVAPFSVLLQRITESTRITSQTPGPVDLSMYTQKQ